MRLFDLTGRTALVTGAAGGLGTAICRALADAGARVLASDRPEAAGQGMADPAFAADLAAPCGADALADAVLAAGGADVLVLNAGAEGPVGPMHAADDDALDRLFRINLRATLTLTARLVPPMAEHGGGSVVLMASIAGFRGNGRIGAYGLTKAALAQHARNLAVEWGPAGVRANAIAPGLIRTPLAVALMADAGFMARRLAATPLRRMGEPDEIAGIVVMLASRAGGFITGQTLIADGGTLISDGS